MTVEENKAIVRRWGEAFNKKDLAAVDEIFAAKYDGHTPGAELNSPESVKELLTVLFTAFPDLHMTVEDLIAEGDKVVIRFTSTGTHQGEYLGIAPTGKQVTGTGIAIYRIVGGKVVEEWAERDTLGMMQQLGVIPSG